MGRRKLLVALPDEHKLVLLDAQRLLDQQPGQFRECEPEATLRARRGRAHDAALAGLARRLAARAGADADASACVTPSYPAPDASALPTPGGFAVTGDRVYVADRTRPVVHVLDVSDPCTDTELPPLLPYSYSTSEPRRHHLARGGEPAVAERSAVRVRDRPGRSAHRERDGLRSRDGSMPAIRTRRTPMVFEGAPRQPYMPPDRLRFNAPVRDISFVMRDFPKPDAYRRGRIRARAAIRIPNASGPGTEYRPNSDYTDGARPVNLRGVFGFAMLTNGQVAVIDVEDFDAPCRRPVTANTSTEFEDLHGCSNDTDRGRPTPLNGVPTVTDESSCNVVEPHRPRSASLSISSSTNGLRAPTLRTFPQFSNPDPSAVITVEQQPQHAGD